MGKRLKRARVLAHSSAHADPEPASTHRLPSTAATLAANARNLTALRDAVVEGASVSAGLWVSYLFVLFYLLVAASGVTHKDLFLGNSIKLPFLSVELPLVGFFWLGPALFLIIHAYVLLHFALLANKVGAFDAELQAQIHDQDIILRLRRQLPSNVFVQLLAGPHEIRNGLMGLMLRVTAHISLAIAPVLLLVFFELQFLPYHALAVTWWQRIAVLIDVALLWALWPSILAGVPPLNAWRTLSIRKTAIWILVSLTPIVLVFAVATFPGESIDGNMISSARLVPTQWPNASLLLTASDPSAVPNSGKATDASSVVAGEGAKKAPGLPITRDQGLFERLAASFRSMGWISLHGWLVAGEVDLRARRPTSLFSNRIVLPGLDAIDDRRFDSEEKLKVAAETVSLRLRDLRGAVLIGAKLRRADFTASNLQEAYLDSADLREAKFECASGKLDVSKGVVAAEVDQQVDCVQLQRASLAYTQLQGATLVRAQMERADFFNADLRGARLQYAQLQGAQLLGTHLDGADLMLANMQGVTIVGSLQAARLQLARMQGAILSNVELQGANIRDAQLQGADLRKADLKGADLSGAQLQGANLDNAELQGVILERTAGSVHRAEFQDASLMRVFVWRSDAPSPDESRGARISAPQTGPAQGCESDESGDNCRWSDQAYEELVKLIQERVPVGSEAQIATFKGDFRTFALNRIKRLKPSNPLNGEAKMAERWEALGMAGNSSNDVYEAALAARLREVGCGAAGPYVIGALSRQLKSRFAANSSQKQELAKAFLDERTAFPKSYNKNSGFM